MGLGGVGGGVSGEDESLSRACDLLVANAHSHLPIKYIEVRGCSLCCTVL